MNKNENKKNDMIEIDGSYGEAGGQILRTAIGLSAITGRSCRIYNIRSGRCNPGLRSQHLRSIEAVAMICNAKVSGAEIGSKEVEFVPGKIKSGKYKIDVGTAGAVTLVLQTLVLPAIYADNEIEFEIQGGTHVRWSPLYDYFMCVFCWFMNKIGIIIDAKIEKYGFFPKGGGIVDVKIKPGVPKEIVLMERGKLEDVRCISIATKNLKKRNVAERQVKGFEDIIKIDKKEIRYVDADSDGSSILIIGEYEQTKIGSSATGEKGKKAEDIGKEAGKELKKQIDSKGVVDKYMSDQLLPFMALAGRGKIKVPEITGHVKTNIWVIEKFLDVKFRIDEKNNVIEL